MGIPTLTFEEDRRQISSSLNLKDEELQQAFLKQHARRCPVAQEEEPCQEDVPHEGCQDSCEDAEVKEASCPVGEVHHLGELEEEGQGGGVQEEPLQREGWEGTCQEASWHLEEVDHQL